MFPNYSVYFLFVQFNPATPISPETTWFISKPSVGEKIHCVAFVMDATTLDVVSSKILHKIKQFQSLMNQKGTQCHQMVTITVLVNQRIHIHISIYLNI